MVLGHAQILGKLHPKRMDYWVFGDAAGDGGRLIKFAWTPIVRHILVKGGASRQMIQPSRLLSAAKIASACRAFRSATGSRQRTRRHASAAVRPCTATDLCVHHITAPRLGGKRTLDNQRLMHLYCHLQALAAGRREECTGSQAVCLSRVRETRKHGSEGSRAMHYPFGTGPSSAGETARPSSSPVQSSAPRQSKKAIASNAPHSLHQGLHCLQQCAVTAKV